MVEYGDVMAKIETVGWYHLEKDGVLVAGANPDLNEPLYKAMDIIDAIREAFEDDATHTRADDVRRMSDVKLAEWLVRSKISWANEMMRGTGRKLTVSRHKKERMIQEALKWLRQTDGDGS